MRSPAVVRNTALGCIDCLQAALRAYVGMERLGIVTPDTSRKHPRISVSATAIAASSARSRNASPAIDVR